MAQAPLDHATLAGEPSATASLASQAPAHHSGTRPALSPEADRSARTTSCSRPSSRHPVALRTTAGHKHNPAGNRTPQAPTLERCRHQASRSAHPRSRAPFSKGAAPPAPSQQQPGRQPATTSAPTHCTRPNPGASMGLSVDPLVEAPLFSRLGTNLTVAQAALEDRRSWSPPSRCCGAARRRSTPRSHRPRPRIPTALPQPTAPPRATWRPSSRCDPSGDGAYPLGPVALRSPNPCQRWCPVGAVDRRVRPTRLHVRLRAPFRSTARRPRLRANTP